MTEFVIAFVVFALAVAGMAIGWIVQRKRLHGSCGGLANKKDEHGRTACEMCTNPAPECRGENANNEPRRDPAETASR